MAGGKPQAIDITTLGLPQLTQLKQQLDQEIDLFGTSLQQLKIAQTKYQESGECVEKLIPETEGKEMLVPLTTSMYVPGNIVDVNKVIVDIGTGYFVEKDIPSAKDYFKRKINFVTQQMEKIQRLANEKITMRDAVIEIMEGKLQATLAAQQMAAPKS
ncbi:prefoldin subunit 5-like [Centruroides sculpturatus]|uniref:prefoldin subunit 5-like n=1 Tax=Centruroides sculpturatus TaxID=218467 RepID=UPI000C6ED1E0|nr:prefoldin subunit 5-like [Centruroides sculpturatus]